MVGFRRAEVFGKVVPRPDDNRLCQMELNNKQDVSCRVRKDDNPWESERKLVGRLGLTGQARAR